ncbi:hypothetical protein MCB86_04490 [Pseudomonas sp. KSR10]|jgi:hypothetical protein|uniref:Uncharacterized protein n=1 Tax=Stutzerimonas stutzeri TaxID=316 RepID=A0A0D9AVC8_STUST|nr:MULTISPECIES: hypothetical protein [Pseudomonadaceae]KJH84953.1 hypothetical protein UF78_01675 [Stutzerimonas stutzeri]MCG6539332.1 hypothetical protein [Pseudomonas sp. KSR10]
MSGCAGCRASSPSLGSAGQWWAARDQLSLDVERDESAIVISLNAIEPIDGISLQLPTEAKVRNVHQIGSLLEGNRMIKHLPAGTTIRLD